MKTYLLLFIVLSALSGLYALEFTQSPSMVKGAGSSWTIEFAVSESTDVEVSVVNPLTNSCVRHLAAGVLGSKAPAPLICNTLSQVLEWDGKDDAGALTANPENLTVRVRAGMGMTHDNFAGGDPYEYSPTDPGLAFGGIVQGSDGSVFLTFTPHPIGTNVVRQYSATGEYVKTLFPIPGDKPVSDYTGWGLNFLTSTVYSPKTQEYYGPLMTNSPLGAFAGFGGFMAGPARGQLGFFDNLSNNLWVMNEDGTCDASTAAATKLFAASPAFPYTLRYANTGRFFAVSPDYSSFLVSGLHGQDTSFWREGRVFKVNMASRSATVLFDLDTVITGAVRSAMLGDYRTELAGVAWGDSGTILLCDRLNNRLLVLDSTGAVLKTFPISKPDNVAYSVSTGAVYVTRMSPQTGYCVDKITNWRTETAVTSTSFICRPGGDNSWAFGYCDNGGPNQTFIVAVPSSEGTILWTAARIGGVVLLKDSGDSLVEYKNFRKLSQQRFTGVKRLAVDPITETAYTTASGSVVYKVDGWSGSSPAFVPCSTSSGRELVGYDLAVDPLHRQLFVRQSSGSPFLGEVYRYSMGRFLTPAPLSAMDTSAVVTNYCVRGTMGVGTADFGIAVAPNGHVASMSVQPPSGLMPTAVRYHPVYDTQTAYRPLILVSNINGGGSICFDPKGNLYVGQPGHSAGEGLPSVITSDLSWNGTTGSIKRYNAAGSLDNDLFTAAPAGPDKVYDVDFGQLGGGTMSICICMTATFGMDGWGRLYVPNGPFQAITILDNEGNRTHRFGSYGNIDDMAAERSGAPGTAGKCYMAYPFCVGASDDYVYAADPGNLILTRFKKTFVLDNIPAMSAVVKSAARASLLLASSPNPFTSRSSINVTLPASAGLTLEIIDLSGRVVKQLASGTHAAGLHTFLWDGLGQTNSRAAAGVYFLRLKTGKSTIAKRIILTR